jgi:hypothetical protein
MIYCNNVCCHSTQPLKKNPSHITFPSLTSHHLLLLQTIAFISIQMEHKDTSQSKVQIKLNIVRLLGNLFLNKHCSTFRAFQMPIELVSNFRLHRKLNVSSQVFFGFQALPKPMHCWFKHQGVPWSVLFDTHVYWMGVRSGALAIFVLLYLGVLFWTFGQVKIPHRGGVS